MFEVGQKVRCIECGPTSALYEDNEYIVRSVSSAGVFVGVNTSAGHVLPGTYRATRFVSVADNQQPVKAGESDPNGTDAHAPGAKLDAGKVRPSLIIEGMARALWAVAEVASFGAAKYTPGGWVLVPQGQERYADAGYRHLLKRAMGEQVDADSKLDHLAHEAWNSLAKLDLYLREKENNNANA